MTWHLKDRFLEEGLCERYPDFLTALNNAAELSVGCNFVAVEFNSQLSNGDIHENHLVFEPDELKEIYEYNPRSWNKYPEVEPPDDELMRFDGWDTYGNRYIGAAACWNGVWSIPKISPEVEAQKKYFGCAMQVIDFDHGKFRPWED